MDRAPKQYDLFATPLKAEPPSGSTRPEESEALPEACYWDYCPNCGSRLHNHGRKYRCPRCFYFMSCSDFD